MTVADRLAAAVEKANAETPAWLLEQLRAANTRIDEIRAAENVARARCLELFDDREAANAHIEQLEIINRIQADTVNAMEAQLAELLPYALSGTHDYLDTDDYPDRLDIADADELAMRARIEAGEFGPWPQEPAVNENLASAFRSSRWATGEIIDDTASVVTYGPGLTLADTCGHVWGGNDWDNIPTPAQAMEAKYGPPVALPHRQPQPGCSDWECPRCHLTQAEGGIYVADDDDAPTLAELAGEQ